MSISVELSNIRSSLSRIESSYVDDIKKRNKIQSSKESTSLIDSIIRGYIEELKDNDRKLKLLIKQIPANNLKLYKEYAELSLKVETIFAACRNNLIDKVNSSQENKKVASINPMSVDDKRVTDDFLKIINQIKRISKEIDQQITKEQIIIEKNSEQIGNLNKNIKTTKEKLTDYISNSSNWCLMITIFIEVFLLVIVLLSL